MNNEIKDSTLELVEHPSLQEKSTEKNKLITAAKAAKYIGLSLPTFRAIVKNNGVKFYTLHKRKKFKRSDLDSLVL